MRGVVEQVWENESRNGQPYLTVQINGERYTVWDTKYFDQLREGAEIEYEFRQSGNFKNITEVRSPSEEQQPQIYQNARDRQITRLSCLKSAAEILAPAQLDPDAKRQLVIDTARVFERYVNEDDVSTPSDDALE
ncbi:MAG: hypothetical protein QI223_05135 [Candidatus Korarchaeota archaeon]|nr:hypothetical protein [Candidatus Korarchaeota archaeon]